MRTEYCSIKNTVIITIFNLRKTSSNKKEKRHYSRCGLPLYCGDGFWVCWTAALQGAGSRNGQHHRPRLPLLMAPEISQRHPLAPTHLDSGQSDWLLLFVLQCILQSPGVEQTRTEACREYCSIVSGNLGRVWCPDVQLQPEIPL